MDTVSPSTRKYDIKLQFGGKSEPLFKQVETTLQNTPVSVVDPGGGGPLGA